MRVILAGMSVVMLVVAILLARPDPVAKADDRVCDALTGLVSRGTPSGLVTIVEIDEESLSQQGRWPWPRDVLGLLVRRILEGGAAAVALDMVLHEEDRGAPATLTGNGNGTNDEVLAGILAGKPVVLGYVFRFDGTSAACAVQPLPMVVSGPAESSRTGFFHAAGALCSVPRISRAAAGNGFLNAAPNADGRLRSLPLVIESGDQYYPSLALAAFQVYRRASSMQLGLGPREASSLRVGTRTVRLEGPSSVRLRFRGPRRTFPYLSAARLLSGRPSPGDLHGQIVIVGGSALGLPNSFASSVDPMLPAVEVQATAIDNLLQGDFFHRAAALHAWELLLALCAGVAATFLLVRVRSWWSPLIVLGLAGGTWAGCAVLLSRTGLLLSPLPVTAVLACAFPVVTLLNYRQEKSRAERTEEKLVESEKAGRAVLRESESRYRRLVENINDAIIIDDAEGRLVFANRRLREWFGFADRDIRTVAIGDYVAPEWRAEVRDRHRRRMNGEDVPQQYEYEGVRPDGSKIWIDALVTKIEEQGRIVGTQAALRDITERKRIEAQYLQAQKMESVGRLAGVVAHDFNNLLTVINGYADLLLKLPPGQAPQHAALQQIRKAGERAAELTRHLLLFSRKQTVQLQALDLNLVVSAEEEMFGRLIGENIRLSTRLSPTLGQVMADAGQLHQVLMNLLVNARDAMPGGGTVTIETGNVEADAEFVRRHPGIQPGSYVYLGVSDTGSGMSDEVKGRLFEPFFTTKEPGKGTGLGLATTYGIVQQYGGRIEVSSKLKEGTTFEIYLPRIEAAHPAQASKADPAPVMHGSETVLVVEDQDAVRRFMGAVLEGCGYRVMEAGNCLDAIAMAKRFPGPIHLLVTDLVLPLMNGQELAARLTSTRPEMRVLFTSGYEDAAIDSRGILAGDAAYLPKPFSPEELAAKVRAALSDPVFPRDPGGKR